MKIFTNPKLPFKLFRKGKVRDVYEIDNNLLIISTDRISAFDFVLPSTIPGKGIVLNKIASYWFKLTNDDLDNHIVEYEPEKLSVFKEFSNDLSGRSVLVKKLKTFPVEAIVRNYIVGSGWKSYQRSGEISGVKLKDGLSFADRLDEPIFTPTTKAEEGHDENISFSKMKDLIGTEYAEKLRELSINLFNKVSDYAFKKGIIIADTKFEFGLDEQGKIVVCDEIFTPDSSRFWKKDEYRKGEEPPSFDKQFVRNFLLNSDWDRRNVPPPLPEDVIGKTMEKYMEIFGILTGEELS